MKTFLLFASVVTALAGVVCVWAWLAVTAAGAAMAHDPYSEWKIPGTTTSCCNNNDCAPVRARVAFDGIWEVWHEGRWLPVPAGAMLPFPSPDGRSHACIIGSAVLCMVPGEIRS